MDRGRQIDNVQNSNAVYLDRFGKSGKTSTKIINPPGGKDHFSLGWDEPKQNNQPQKQQQSNKPRIERKKEQEPRTIPSQYHPKQQSHQPPVNNQNQQHTSVRVNQRPGGNSNIIFGTDDSNYEHYRK